MNATKVPMGKDWIPQELANLIGYRLESYCVGWVGGEEEEEKERKENEKTELEETTDALCYYETNQISLTRKKGHIVPLFLGGHPPFGGMFAPPKCDMVTN